MIFYEHYAAKARGGMRIQRVKNERPTIVYNLAGEITIQDTIDSKTA